MHAWALHITEKYYFSNEDLLLYDINGRKDVVTEQMVTYPLIDLTAGDLKKDPLDKYSIFRQNYGDEHVVPYLDMAVEICLGKEGLGPVCSFFYPHLLYPDLMTPPFYPHLISDHKDVRLRMNLDNNPFPKDTDGIYLQLVPSCGMQLKKQSIAANKNGWAFNVDGQYALDDTKDKTQKGCVGEVDCLYTNYIHPVNKIYAAHTQLARVDEPAKRGFHSHQSSHATDATYHPLGSSEENAVVIPVEAIADLDRVFSGGPGQVHIYGLKKPFAILKETLNE